ncbi:hypothetical protein ACROYT_G003635 [Oculina patagonica]
MKVICFFLLLTAVVLDAASGRDHEEGQDVLQKRQMPPCGALGPDFCVPFDVPCGGGNGMCPPGLKCCR